MQQTTILPFSELSNSKLYAILQLRSEVFVLEQNCPYQDMDGLDQVGWHVVVANEADEVQAYARILPPGTSYEKYASIGRVVTHPRARGTGLGRRLMESSIVECEKLFPGKAIKISAQKYLLRFYESLGFVPTGEEYLEDGIPHLAMVRE